MSRIVIYSPTDTVVAHRVTRYLLSANTPDFDGEPNKLVDPDLAVVASVAEKYWKHSAGAVVEMSAGEKAAIDAIPPNYDIQLAKPQPQTPGYEMCDRDIKLETVTGVVEDLKVNPTTMLESDWGEVTLVGKYKVDAGAMVVCADQADADANCILTIWDYKAKKQSDASDLAYEVRGGNLVPDPGIPANERYAHRAYVVAAPGIPASFGGQVRLFDGYLGVWSGELESMSPAARHLDPALGAGASVLRLYFYHPAGVAGKRTHVLRLVTYRPQGSF